MESKPEPVFKQPKSKDDKYLGTLCFAYATINALDKCGISLPFSDQSGADTWIKQQGFSGNGGGPGVVLEKLSSLKPLEPKQTPVQFVDKDIKLSIAKYALENKLPIILGTTVGNSNHWIFVDSVEGETIKAWDQQNSQRKLLSFVSKDNKFTAQKDITVDVGVKTITYEINKMSVFITKNEQRDALNNALKQ